MPQEMVVQTPPPKPLMIFDGDCRFCCRWVERWRGMAPDAVDFVPLQDEAVAQRFPEIPLADLEEAVHMVMPDGHVYRGAEAVFCALAAGNRHRWLLALYRKIPTVADLSELVYEEVAYHRIALSKWDRIYSGPGIAPPSYLWTRYIFLRGLALIYLIAFLSLWVQVDGLVGSKGIFPAADLMSSIKTEASLTGLGVERYLRIPTLGWLSATDQSLHWQCGVGVACSIALLAGVAPTLMTLILWGLYLSLSVLGGPFLSFQWDTLLLEAGFLAILFAPLQWFEVAGKQPKPSGLVIWLYRWLIFRLMLESGCVKLMSADATWWNLSALRVHYETQPLPTWIGWYAHQWPRGAQSACTVAMFVIELVVPVFIFAGRRMRICAGVIFALFQVAILLTGNYTFFNWLTIVLCLPLFDDKALAFWRKRNEPESWQLSKAAPTSSGRRWPWPVTLVLTLLIVVLTIIPLFRSAGIRQVWPAPVGILYSWAQPLRSFNGYGLFAVMTPARPEIIVQGSDDGEHWRDYEFKYKPGDVHRAPRFVAPYQPRLDWQMWFAALDPLHSRGWFLTFEERLLEGSKPVLDLLGPNPFPEKPPKYVRSMLYQYHFTDQATRKRTGDWWRRDLIEVYVPPLTLDDFRRLRGSN